MKTSPNRVTKVVPGSARGARVGGVCFGGLGTAATMIGCAGYPWAPAPLLFFAIFAYWIVRPWFMGIPLEADAVLIKSWYRRYRIPYSAMVVVRNTEYFGLVAKTPIGWLPFVGVIGTVQIVMESGRRRDFPCTVARLRTILEVCREIREAAGLSVPRFDINDPNTYGHGSSGE